MGGNGFPLHIHIPFHVTFSSAGGMVAISMAARVPVRCSMHCRREARRARYVLCCAVVYTYVSSNNWRKYRKSSSITLHRSSTSITSPPPLPPHPPPISSKQALSDDHIYSETTCPIYVCGGGNWRANFYCCWDARGGYIDLLRL